MYDTYNVLYSILKELQSIRNILEQPQKRVSKKDKKSFEKRIIDRPILEPQNSMMMERKETNGGKTNEVK
jgi:hypothetical protein